MRIMKKRVMPLSMAASSEDVLHPEPSALRGIRGGVVVDASPSMGADDVKASNMMLARNAVPPPPTSHVIPDSRPMMTSIAPAFVRQDWPRRPVAGPCQWPSEQPRRSASHRRPRSIQRRAARGCRAPTSPERNDAGRSSDNAAAVSQARATAWYTRMTSPGGISRCPGRGAGQVPSLRPNFGGEHYERGRHCRPRGPSAGTVIVQLSPTVAPLRRLAVRRCPRCASPRSRPHRSTSRSPRRPVRSRPTGRARQAGGATPVATGR